MALGPNPAYGLKVLVELTTAIHLTYCLRSLLRYNGRVSNKPKKSVSGLLQKEVHNPRSGLEKMLILQIEVASVMSVVITF